ncbi:putative pyridoxal phosphate-dependent, cell-wall biogenesis regulatory protein, partial [Moorena producens 3L]
LTSSCHGALHLVLKAIGVEKGDEVIVPDITWASGTVFPVCWVGAKPIFVDVKQDTWCIDPSLIEAKITSKTKAIIAVHLYGNMADMDELRTIANRHNLILIEDAAEAIGSAYKGMKAGTIGDFGVFSFHGTKTVTTGEGGVIITNSDKYTETLSTLENQGRKPGSRLFWCEEIGLKYKMSNIQAALGLAQFERVEELVQKKRWIFEAYKNQLSDLPDKTMNHEDIHVTNGFWQPTIVFGDSWAFDEGRRNQLVDDMIAEKVQIRPFFYPVSSMPPFESNANDENEISYSIYKTGINLPSYHELESEDISYIVQKLKNHLSS